jgi:transposase
MTTMATRRDRAPGIEHPGRMSGAGTQRPDSEVPARTRWRTLTAQDKLEIPDAYDAAPQGAKGALLRRKGLYSSHIVEWRRARDAGALAELSSPRGRPRGDPRDERIAGCGAGRPASGWMCTPLPALWGAICESEAPEPGSRP